MTLEKELTVGRVTLVKSVPGLADYIKEALQNKGMYRLDDLRSCTVGEVWLLLADYYDPDQFAHLIRAMKSGKITFYDCDLSEVDLLANDLDRLELSASVRNPLARDRVRSIELMRRLGARRLRDKVRVFGPSAVKQLRLAFKKLDLELPD